MRVRLYGGSLALVRKSGVGKAVEHQRAMLERCGVTVTDHPDAGIVHCNTVFPDAWLTANWARLRGRKVVYYGHSTMEDFRNSFRGSNRLAPLFRWWITRCYNSGSIVITPTEYARRLLLSYGVRVPVYVLSNGVDTSFFAPSRERRGAFRKKYGLSDTDRAVLSVGHMIARKGLVEFVEMARSMPETRFFWFGYTAPELIPAHIRQTVETAPPNVTFPGFVSPEELRDAYCGCDVFAFLSREETEGIVVLEALACGIPTVLRDIPVYDGWLSDGVQVYKGRDNRELRDRVEGLLSGRLPPLTAAGLKTARQRDLETVGRRLRRIYAHAGFLESPEPRRLGGPTAVERSYI